MLFHSIFFILFYFCLPYGETLAPVKEEEEGGGGCMRKHVAKI